MFWKTTNGIQKTLQLLFGTDIIHIKYYYISDYHLHYVSPQNAVGHDYQQGIPTKIQKNTTKKLQGFWFYHICFMTDNTLLI